MGSHLLPEIRASKQALHAHLSQSAPLPWELSTPTRAPLKCSLYNEPKPTHLKLCIQLFPNGKARHWVHTLIKEKKKKEAIDFILTIFLREIKLTSTSPFSVPVLCMICTHTHTRMWQLHTAVVVGAHSQQSDHSKERGNWSYVDLTHQPCSSVFVQILLFSKCKRPSPLIYEK